MGAWGTSLYSNDTACDMRGDYVDRLKRGKTNEEITRELIEENREIMGDEEEEPLFWFALADTQWNYGRLLPEVKEKALYWLAREEELERWRESGEKQLQAWIKTREKLKEKLESPQPPEKKVYKYRLYKCKWQLGDVFAYRFTSPYSEEKGYKDKYFVFRKVSEDTCWPGHIIPVIQVYAWIGYDLPSLDDIKDRSILPLRYYLAWPNRFGDDVYNISIYKESDKEIPNNNLTYIGNVPGDDLMPLSGWKNYYPVGWEMSKYNNKIEHVVIDEVFSIWTGM